MKRRSKRLLFLAVLVAGGLFCYWAYFFYWLRLGTSKQILKYRPPVCQEVSSINNKLSYTCPFNGLRLWVPLKEISPRLRELVILMEDDRFFEHSGLDFTEIKNAIEEDLEKGKLSRGGSTITQQLAKNLFLSKDKSFVRKANEVPMAMRLEQELSKQKILELYLNTIEWGPSLYGAEAVSRQYFDKPASELTEYETWLLVVMIPNPKELFLWNKPKAKKSILKRAHALSQRLVLKHEMSRAVSFLKYSEFESFLNHWETLSPKNNNLSERRFPYWSN